VFYLLALLIGVFTGARTLTPIAAVSWAARLGRLHLEGTWLSFLSAAATPYIFSVLALAELVNDKLPKTPSRKTPPQFIGRVLMGALAGAAIGASNQNLIVGLLLGAVGAVIGTLGGAEIRGRLTKAFGKDLPAALIEDAVTIIGSFLVAFQNA
jgi:uncharacterized membrane protein